MSLKVFISTGEVSGDIVGALLTREILLRDPGALIFGIGGSRMAAAGVRVDFVSDHLGAVGVTEAVATFPSLPRAFSRIRRGIRQHRPDVAVLIGNDLFNVCLARWLKSQGVRRIAYFPPQVWVWRSVAPAVAKSFDAILASFPDEYSIYRDASRDTEVTFVGHYLVDVLRPLTVGARREARSTFGVTELDAVVGIFPGSRWHEVRALLPVMLDAARNLAATSRSIRFLLPVVDQAQATYIDRQIRERDLSGNVLVTQESHLAMAAADLLFLASGTASLEAALLGVPAIITYKVSTFSHLIVRACIRLGLIESYEVGLPNLILRQKVVPELLQSEATADALTREADKLLKDPARRQHMRTALSEVATRISGDDCLGRTADIILTAPRRHDADAPMSTQASAPRAWEKALK